MAAVSRAVTLGRPQVPIEPIEPMPMSAHLMCAECPSPFADMACLCTWPGLPLCRQCVPRHLSQRDGVHIPLEVSPALSTVSEAQVRTAIQRKAQLTAVKERLNQVYHEIEACRREVETNFESEKRKLKAAKAKALAELTELECKLKTELQREIEEASRSLLRTNFRSALSRDLLERGEASLRDYLSAAISSPVSQFSKAIIPAAPRMQEAEDQVPPSLQISETPTIPLLPILNCRNLRFFDPSSGSWSCSALSSKELIPKGFPAVIMTMLGLICCGGGYYQPPSKLAFSVTFAGEITALRDMKTARASQGMICVGKWVYCFGGTGENKVLRECERLAYYPTTTGGTKWERIADMATARRCFSPCYWEEMVYICGGWTTATIEVFNLSTLTFTMLSVSLPEASEAVSVVSNWELIVITQHFFLRYHISTHFQAISKHYTWSCFSGNPSILNGNQLFTFSQGQIIEIDLKTANFDRVSPPNL